MPIVMNKSAIMASAAFVCANASADSKVADVTTKDGFTAESSNGLRVFRNDAASAPATLAGVFETPIWQGEC